jgi:hypothetical protein
MQQTTARDYYFLDLLEGGETTTGLARRFHITRRAAQSALQRARRDRRLTDALKPTLIGPPPYRVPLFGCRAFTPNTVCGDIHHGPIPRNSSCICMVCHQDRNG